MSGPTREIWLQRNHGIAVGSVFILRMMVPKFTRSFGRVVKALDLGARMSKYSSGISAWVQVPQASFFFLLLDSEDFSSLELLDPEAASDIVSLRKRCEMVSLLWAIYHQVYTCYSMLMKMALD